MAKIATSYSSYQELLLDIDLYGNIIANSSLDKKEYYNLLLSEYIRTNGDPSLKQRRYMLSDLVDSNFKIQYDNDIELMENEELFGFDEDDTTEEAVPQLEELDFDIPKEVQEQLKGLTDSQRLERASSLEYFKEKYKYEESIEEKLKNINFDEDTTYIALPFEESYDLNIDLISSLLSDKNDEEEVSFEDTDGVDYESYEEPADESENYEDTDEDSYEDADEYVDEDSYVDEDEGSYEDTDENVDEDSYVDTDEDSYVDDTDYVEESQEINTRPDTGTVNKVKETPRQPEHSQVLNTYDDEDLGFVDNNVVAFNPSKRQDKKPVQRPQSKAPPTPYQVSHRQQELSKPKVDTTKVVDKNNLPKTVKEFLRQHPNSETSFVLQFYSKQQVQKELMMGNIIKKGTKLHI